MPSVWRSKRKHAGAGLARGDRRDEPGARLRGDHLAGLDGALHRRVAEVRASPWTASGRRRGRWRSRGRRPRASRGRWACRRAARRRGPRCRRRGAGSARRRGRSCARSRRARTRRRRGTRARGTRTTTMVKSSFFRLHTAAGASLAGASPGARVRRAVRRGRQPVTSTLFRWRLVRPGSGGKSTGSGRSFICTTSRPASRAASWRLRRSFTRGDAAVVGARQQAPARRAARASASAASSA